VSSTTATTGSIESSKQQQQLQLQLQQQQQPDFFSSSLLPYTFTPGTYGFSDILPFSGMLPPAPLALMQQTQQMMVSHFPSRARTRMRARTRTRARAHARTRTAHARARASPCLTPAALITRPPCARRAARRPTCSRSWRRAPRRR